MNESTLNDKRLETIAVLLGMDLAVPYYDKMGLEIADAKEVVAAFRSVTRELEEERAADGPSTPLTPRALETLERQLGRQFRDSFLRWALCVFENVPADHPQTYAWSAILSWCAANPDNWSELKLPTEKSFPLWRRFRRTSSDADYHDLDERAREEPFSDWDKKTFIERGFDDDILDPCLWIINTISLHRFQTALNDLLGRLEPVEIEALRETAEQIGLSKELISVDKLEDPRNLLEPASGE